MISVTPPKHSKARVVQEDPVFQVLRKHGLDKGIINYWRPNTAIKMYAG